MYSLLYKAHVTYLYIIFYMSTYYKVCDKLCLTKQPLNVLDLFKTRMIRSTTLIYWSIKNKKNTMNIAYPYNAHYILLLMHYWQQFSAKPILFLFEVLIAFSVNELLKYTENVSNWHFNYI